MKAKFRNRLVDDRHDLGAVAPLSTPFVLIVDPSSRCNFKCHFCPTGDRDLIEAIGRKPTSLDFETFKKIIDELQEFPSPVKVLRLYKEGEPLMNKRLPEMIAYARRSDKVQRIDMTTNGALLNPKLSEAIIASGIDQINVSVNGVKDEQFIEMVQTKVSFDKFAENVKYLCSIKGDCLIYVKAIFENLSEDDRKKFFDTFGDVADRIFFEHLFSAWPGFDDESLPREHTVSHYGDEIVERVVCPYLFYSIAVNADGSVSACLPDWERKLIVGDVHTEKIRDIWLGERMNAHRIQHLAGRRKDNPTCGQCQVMSMGVIDNIDAQTKGIEQRLLAKEYYHW